MRLLRECGHDFQDASTVFFHPCLADSFDSAEIVGGAATALHDHRELLIGQYGIDGNGIGLGDLLAEFPKPRETENSSAERICL